MIPKSHSFSDLLCCFSIRWYVCSSWVSRFFLMIMMHHLIILYFRSDCSIHFNILSRSRCSSNWFSADFVQWKTFISSAKFLSISYFWSCSILYKYPCLWFLWIYSSFFFCLIHFLVSQSSGTACFFGLFIGLLRGIYFFLLQVFFLWCRPTFLQLPHTLKGFLSSLSWAPLSVYCNHLCYSCTSLCNTSPWWHSEYFTQDKKMAVLITSYSRYYANNETV